METTTEDGVIDNIETVNCCCLSKMRFPTRKEGAQKCLVLAVKMDL